MTLGTYITSRPNQQIGLIWVLHNNNNNKRLERKKKKKGWRALHGQQKRVNPATRDMDNSGIGW